MKKYITLSIIIIFSIVCMIFVNNNYSFYKNDIIKITSIDTIYIETRTNSLNLEEDYYIQNITGTLMNGNLKGGEYIIENTITTSSVFTETYSINDELILKNGNIENLKRDKYIVLLFLVFLVGIFLVGSFKGLKTIFTVLINGVIFYISLELYLKGFNLLFLTVIESIIFTITSLMITSGNNSKTYSAIVSTFISMIILLIITYLVSLVTDFSGISFNHLSYITVPIQDIFLASLIIGALGAIMDVSITISATVGELIKQNRNISKKLLICSCTEVGKDIMGTMVNVIFFTYLCSGLPIFILSIRNGVTLTNYINSSFSVEVTRFLVASIGIVLTIPIASYISIKLAKGSDKYE